tara:strand:+ start:495 stop:635 length:141 start_codon:yes stop_codon:yes gene_type:complete
MIARKYKGLFEGIEFKKALFSIWLGGNSCGQKVKKQNAWTGLGSAF